jgi:hypothetical protein
MILGGKFPDTLSMRIRKYDAVYGEKYPTRLLPFKALKCVVSKVDEDHFEDCLEEAVSEIREILVKHYRKKP